MSTEPRPLPLEGLSVVPVGPLDGPLLGDLVQHLSRRFLVPCRIRAEPDGPAPPRLAGREQVDADALLSRLEALPRQGGEVLVGVTALDIGNPIFTFFFGRARRGGGAALVSLARLTPTYYGLPADPGATRRRALAEILHELGHVAGLGHCQARACVMRFCTNVEAIDQRGVDFCSACHPPLPVRSQSKAGA